MFISAKCRCVTHTLRRVKRNVGLSNPSALHQFSAIDQVFSVSGRPYIGAIACQFPNAKHSLILPYANKAQTSYIHCLSNLMTTHELECSNFPLGSSQMLGLFDYDASHYGECACRYGEYASHYGVVLDEGEYSQSEER